jgi:hypothetical protein
VISYKLPLDAANRLVSNSPQDLDYFVLRPEERHWDGRDIRALFGGPALQRRFSFWKFTRLLTDKNGALGLAASKLRGGRPAELFPRCPQIEKLINKAVIPDILGTQTFIHGVADLAPEEIEKTSIEIVSLFLSGSWGRSCLSAF